MTALDAITAYLRTDHRMAIGTNSAEAIKLAIGSATALFPELEARVRGRDLTSGLPREEVLTSNELRSALEPLVAEIVAAVHSTLEESPPELAADMTRHGILICGGGALLRGFAERLDAETGMSVRIADDPLTCVATGAGHALEELDRMGANGGPSRRRR